MLALGIASACAAFYSAVRRKRVQKQCTVQPAEEVWQPTRQSFDEIVRDTLDEWLDGGGDLSLLVLEFCTVDETKIDSITADGRTTHSWLVGRDNAGYKWVWNGDLGYGPENDGELLIRINVPGQPTKDFPLKFHHLPFSINVNVYHTTDYGWQAELSTVQKIDGWVQEFTDVFHITASDDVLVISVSIEYASHHLLWQVSHYTYLRYVDI
jgi:hypothetical protein